MSLLENPLPGLLDGTPYGIIPGNHDLPTTNFNKYFGVSSVSGRDYYGGSYGSSNDNNNALISVAGIDFIVINLEFQPRSGVLDWADALLNSHSSCRGIVISHSMLNIDNSWSFQGIFDTLKGNPNLFLMLCGHANSPTDGAAQRRPILTAAIPGSMKAVRLYPSAAHNLTRAGHRRLVWHTG